MTAAVGRAVTTVVIKLLHQAGTIVDADHPTAKSYIDRATTLLESVSERDEAVARQDDQMSRAVLAPWQARRATEFVTENLELPIRTNDLAAVVDLSKSHFSKAFKGTFGVTARAYVVKRRMQRAQELMLTTDEPLSQIALACGLSDQAQFSKMFRRELGLSPTVWRRSFAGCQPCDRQSIAACVMTSVSSRTRQLLDQPRNDQEERREVDVGGFSLAPAFLSSNEPDSESVR